MLSQLKDLRDLWITRGVMGFIDDKVVKWLVDFKNLTVIHSDIYRKESRSFNNINAFLDRGTGKFDWIER